MTVSDANWTIGSDYPSPENEKNLSFWAWQFLRRNQAYQVEWKEYTDSLKKMASRIPDLLPYVKSICDESFCSSDEGKAVSRADEWNKLAALAENQIETFYVVPQPLSTETTVKEWVSRVSLLENKKGVHISRKSLAIGKEWGVNRMKNPASFSWDVEDRFLINGAVSRFLGGSNSYAGDDNYLVPVLDMRYPVDVLRFQFEQILKKRNGLIKAKKIIPLVGRPQRSLPLFHNYLRVLDAVDSGARIPEIANVLLPHQDIDDAKKVVRNWMNAAKEIRSKTYIELPAYYDTKVKKR